jgi:hypothetical protein
MAAKFKKGDIVRYRVPLLGEGRYRHYSAVVKSCGEIRAVIESRFELDDDGKEVGEYLGYRDAVSPDTLTPYHVVIH